MTPTVKLASVLNHFGIPSITFQTLVSSGKVYYQPVLPKQLYFRVGDTATFAVILGFVPGTVNTGYDSLCKALSGHKLYTMVNGAYAQGLNLEGKLVVQ